MVIAFSGFKGGTGKSALAVNTAAQWARAGRRVRLLDLDTNQKDTLWFAPSLQVLGVEVLESCADRVRQQIAEAQGAGCVLDTGPSATRDMAAALAVATVVVVPIAGVLAFKNISPFRRALEDARRLNPRLQVLYVLTFQDRSIKDFALLQAEAAQVLGAELLPCLIHRRALWEKAARERQDLETFNARHLATREAQAFACALWDRMHHANTSTDLTHKPV